MRHVDATGTQRAIAGNGHDGASGDGGPNAASLSVSGLAALPGGGYLIADGHAGRVRMVDAGGVINTVAGGGKCAPTACRRRRRSSVSSTRSGSRPAAAS